MLRIKIETMKQQETAMPLVQVHTIKGVFTPEMKKKIIEKVTDAMVAVEGENLRGVTCVTINEIDSGDWGIGGRALTAEDGKALAAGQAAAFGTRSQLKNVSPPRSAQRGGAACMTSDIKEISTMSILLLPSSKQTKVVELTATALVSLITLWKAYVARQIRSAAKITLYQLDDRTLKDIGLHRSEIDSAVNTFMRDRITSL